ncbi:Response regulator protein TmoT [Botrimarina colliarenosi]|uniref:Response regulator protein TmoT n=1 Tax=Botrimarina colliarenosi TaxID=2528001 RepID=A0A5C6AGP5_9BACT|nr:response regulator [Botrimarina colliarenosi]TWT99144.1 Response regulator protein TmoT [Botrimarina colliarenosi]
MVDGQQSDSDLQVCPVVYVVEDDEPYAAWLDEVLQSANLTVRLYTHPSKFLAEFSVGSVECIILDVRLPEMSGFELHRKLVERGVPTPVMMITSFGEVPDAVEAIRAGAVDYIQKPVSAAALLDRVQRALQVSIDQQESNKDLLAIRDSFRTLSPREVQVLDLLLEGKTTKQVAMSLGIGLTTVDFHRHNVLQKMRVENVVELAHVMDRYNQLKPS